MILTGCPNIRLTGHKMSDKDKMSKRGDKMSVIFKNECEKLNIEFDTKNVKKIDPKTKNVLWSSDVAFPTTVDGFVRLMGEKRSLDFLVDKTSIWLRSQNDPRRATQSIEIDGKTYTKSELIEIAKRALAEKM
jgi:uncharacterized membrane protein